jgi:enoyl-CoA hydratase
MLNLTHAELIDRLRSPFGFETLGVDHHVVTVDCRSSAPPADWPGLLEKLAGVPVVVVGIVDDPETQRQGATAFCDVVITPDDPAPDSVLETIAEFPNASVSLAVLLRGSEGRGVGEGLAAESAVYSLLQGGPEFAAWRASRPIAERPSETSPAVEVSREDDVLTLTLNRPEVHNAYNVRMRDELIAGLTLAAADASVRRVVVDGRGPSFCSGGDLDEFGSRSDPASAHVVRLATSAGRAIAAIAPKVEVHLHGACLGSGIELAAFAGTVVAHPDTIIGLPEIHLGLIPGAGGTVSLPARIGRQRTAYLALSGRHIDAATAKAWGLVDTIIEQI